MKQFSATILKKITLKNTSMLLLACSALGLAACQTNSSNPQTHKRGYHGGPHHQGMKPNDRAGMSARHHQRQPGAQAWREQMQQACLNKNNGATVNVKIDDKTLSGQCHLVFQPDRNSMQSRVNHQSVRPQQHAGSNRRGAWSDLDRQAFQQACIGKSADQKTTVQFNEQSINGRCQLRFKRTAPNA
ncbi:hypothetical protein [Acinetobacter larvae]|uniref:Uncharacterized protein n=1 Tax=Acinetobacter larvae TaxID=1789224 RepID=A0A1B2LX12_9GAMM|nr:hypothetical protein [Acinetobacter larvae]AOA57481.1 hypothetical protein BFG52_03340 [Acinetobacter larvae]